MMWVYIPKTQNIVLWYLVWLSHEGSINCANLDQCALFSVNTHTHTHTEWRKADFYFTSLFPSCFFNQAKLRNQWNGSYVVFFPFKTACAFFFPSLCSSDTLSVRGGWLAPSLFPLAERGCVDGRDCQLCGLRGDRGDKGVRRVGTASGTRKTEPCTAH